MTGTNRVHRARPAPEVVSLCLAHFSGTRKR